MGNSRAVLGELSHPATPKRSGARTLNSILDFARSSPVSFIAGMTLLTIILIAVFADKIAPYDPLAGDYGAIRESPSAQHLFGTDSLGRDVLSRIIHGARVSLIVGFGAILLGDVLGFAWGVSSGYVGKRFDLVSQRFLEVLLAFPGLILATLFVMALGSGLVTVIIAVGVTMIPATTRVTRSVAMSVKEMTYVDAARVVGASPSRIMLRHIAPQCIAAFLVISTAHLGIAITVEAALSFLGIGVPPPTPSWGTMLGGATATMFSPPWWLAVFPGLAITVTVLSMNMIGDGLRDLLDPNLRRRLH